MKRSILIIALCGLTVVPAVASADPIGIEFTGTGKGQVITLAGIRNVTTFAGEINWQFEGAPPTGWDPSFYSYCVDVTSNLDWTQDVALKSTNAMPAAGSLVAWLLNEYAPDIHTTTERGDAKAAGLQIAIWETLYDPGFNILSGGFRVDDASAGALKYANDYLTGLKHHSGAAVETTWLDTNHGQDQIALNPVPEPGTLLLLGSGIAALVARHRRRRAVGNLI